MADFIEVTDDESHKVLINKKHIIIINNAAKGLANIVLVKGNTIWANESYEEIKRLINE